MMEERMIRIIRLRSGGVMENLDQVRGADVVIDAEGVVVKDRGSVEKREPTSEESRVAVEVDPVPVSSTCQETRRWRLPSWLPWSR